MKEVNVREARQQLARILQEVEQGEEVRILRRGRPVARLTRPDEPRQGFGSRADLREELPAASERVAHTTRAIRDAERY